MRFICLLHIERQRDRDRHTNRQTNGRTDGQTETKRSQGNRAGVHQLSEQGPPGLCQSFTRKKTKKRKTAKGIRPEWTGHQFFGQRPQGDLGDVAAK